MDIRQLLEADYLDILFQNRNKRYGGYELRRHYPDRARRSLLAVLLAAGIGFTIPVIAGKSEEEHMKYPYSETEVVIRDIRRIPSPERPQPTMPTQPPAPPAVRPTVSNPPLTVVADDLANRPPKPVDSMEGRVVGLADNPGSAGGLQPDIGQGSGTGNRPAVDSAAPSTAAAFKWVEQMPEFGGDLGRYLGKAVQYPEAAREAGLEGRVVVQFVVNEDGAITGVEILKGAGPLLDQEAVRVVSAMPKWKPGRQNGQPVKVYFQLPIHFRLGE